ncbi:MAG: 50S ribosomal protein L13 [Salibacteraceae bacterium]
MSHLSYKTVSANAETVTKEWVIVDAKDQTLGRFSSMVAYLLRGKHKTNFTPHVDCGDNVIVINAEAVNLSGQKWEEKRYLWHTGYPGGQRTRTASEALKRDPRKIIENAVKGMLPKNKLGRQMFRNLHVYAGNEHPHEAQKPKVIDINSIK